MYEKKTMKMSYGGKPTKKMEMSYGGMSTKKTKMMDGGMGTKKKMGSNDYRSGGMVLSSVDNKKKMG